MGLRCFVENNKERMMAQCDECGVFFAWSRPSVEKLKILAEEHGWSVTFNIFELHRALCPRCKNGTTYKILPVIRHPNGTEDFLPDDNGACYWKVCKDDKWLADFWDKKLAEIFVSVMKEE